MRCVAPIRRKATETEGLVYGKCEHRITYIPQIFSINQCDRWTPKNMTSYTTIIHFLCLAFPDYGITISRAETNIRNVTNEPFSKRTNIRIFVRFDD